MTASKTAEIGTYRPAARLKAGWHLTQHGVWVEISSVVQILSPGKFAMVKLANGSDVSIPHSHEVMTRGIAEIAQAKRAEGGADHA